MTIGQGSTVVRTSYVSPTDTTGAFIRVTEAGTRRQRTYPYDYAARDVHECAAGRFAREVCGIVAPVIDYADGRQPSRGYRFAITESV